MALAYSLAEQNFDENAVNRVVLLTDGDFNVGITNENTLEDFVSGKRETDIYLSVYGIRPRQLQRPDGADAVAGRQRNCHVC